MKIEGVLHEFTSIPGIVEDVTEMILNLKQVRMKLVNKKANKLELTLKGPGELTAKDLQDVSADIEILNPDLHIATLNKDANLAMEIRFGLGKGYVPGNEQNIADQTIGLIPLIQFIRLSKMFVMMLKTFVLENVMILKGYHLK